jgi:hypothetical protein
MWYALYSIFPILFNIAFFAIGGVDRKASVWISWGFIHFAYVTLLLSPRFSQTGRSTAILGIPPIAISGLHFALAFFLGMIFILVSPNGYTMAVLMQLFLAGVYIAVLLVNMLANASTTKSIETQQEQIAYIKTAATRLRCLLENVTDKQMKKKVEAAYDELRTSPVKSHLALTETENRIGISIDELESAIEIKENGRISVATDALLNAIKERNRQLRQFN